MAKCVSNIANEIIISSPLDSLQSTNNYLKSHLSIPKIFQKINFSSYEIIPNQKIAFKKAISTNSPVVVTGSLYLLSEIYPLLNKIKK
jgi:folylpolyglutamate synthase/dihydropteroate synthase